MIKEPITIAATAHYSMGGIPVNKNGKVRKNNTEFVDGFYAAGECSCVSVHGANRLGANSVLEAMLFGRHVGECILNDLDSIEFVDAIEEDAFIAVDRINKLKANNGTQKVPELRTILQDSMTANAGVFRTEESLLKQQEILKDLKEKYKDIRIDDKSSIFNTDLQEAIELGHMIDFARFIVDGAIVRKESRGAHFRDDFPTRDDENFLKHTMAYMDENGDISIDYMDVVMGKFKPEVRTY
jgi:succinate dehydrogenase / fumarate reductase flavoprotein subunit